MSAFYSFLLAHPFAELGVILAIVIALSYVMKVLKQPLMIGYILTGLIVSPHLLGLLHNTEGVQIFSHLGVTLLLFMVGSSLNTRELKEIGGSALCIGIVQILASIGIGALISVGLGYDRMTSIFIGVALSLSSTIIIIKLLSDQGKIDDVFAKITIGVLVLQDIVAMIVLIILSSLPTGTESVNRGWFGLVMVGKICSVALVAIALTRYVLPRLLARVAQSQEFLFIFAMGRCLLRATSMEMIGFSLEIGALIAGLTIASLPYRFEIVSKMKPLRDFFIVLFFVSLGSQVNISTFSSSRMTIIVLTGTVLILKPLTASIPMKLLGYHTKTSILTGMTLGQVSEFSFILIGVGVSMGLIQDSELVSILTIVGLLTIAGSSYYISNGQQIANRLSRYLHRYPDSPRHETAHHSDIYDIIIFGNHRTGKSIVDMLIAQNKKFVIIDYDPTIIKKLEQQHIPCLYGDAADLQLLETINVDKAKMIVSTIHDYETNALILHQTKKFNTKLITILSTHTIQDAESLYNQGASYVLVPHAIGGHHTAMMIEQYEYDIEKYTQKKMEEYGVLR